MRGRRRDLLPTSLRNDCDDCYKGNENSLHPNYLVTPNAEIQLLFLAGHNPGIGKTIGDNFVSGRFRYWLHAQRRVDIGQTRKVAFMRMTAAARTRRRPCRKRFSVKKLVVRRVLLVPHRFRHACRQSTDT